jgi:hypothetical protein
MKPSYDKLLYAASILSQARADRLELAKKSTSDGERDSWEEGAKRLGEVIAWLDGGAL